MPVPPPAPRTSIDQAIDRPDRENYELVDGMLTVRAGTLWSAYLAGQIIVALTADSVSMADMDYPIGARIADYQQAEVPLLWIVRLDQGVIDVYETGRTVASVPLDADLTGGNVLSGLRCRLADLVPVWMRPGASAIAATA